MCRSQFPGESEHLPGQFSPLLPAITAGCPLGLCHFLLADPSAPTFALTHPSHLQLEATFLKCRYDRVTFQLKILHFQDKMESSEFEIESLYLPLATCFPPSSADCVPVILNYFYLFFSLCL